MSDFFRPIVMSGAVDNAVVAAVQRIMIRAQQSLPWLPNLSAESSAAFYADPPTYPALNLYPAGLTDDQQQAWAMIYQAMQPITSSVLAGEMAQAQAAGEQLASNADFWTAVTRITKAVATVGFSEVAPIVAQKWDELRAKLQEWKDTRAWALKISSDPRCPADKGAQLRKKITDLDSSIAGKVTSVVAQIPGFQEPFKQEGLGFVAALSALATVQSGVAIAAIVAVVAVIAYAISSIKGLVDDLGLGAIGSAIGSASKLLGPFLGVAVLGLIGFIVYKKYAAKTA